MAWTRASQLQRSIQCPGSAYLYNTVPAVRLARKSDNALNAAEYGTIAHHWKQFGEIPQKTESDPTFDRWNSAQKTFQKKLGYIETRGITRENVWPGGWHEVSVAYNCVDKRVSVQWEGDAVSFKQAHTLDWITGTADWVKFDSGTILLDDLKTGAMFDDEPDEMAQMYLYMLCFSKVFRANKYVPSVTTWPKYPIENEPERINGDCKIEISQSQLDKFEDLLSKKYQKYGPNFKLGSECLYCPAMSICPLQKQVTEKI